MTGTDHDGFTPVQKNRLRKHFGFSKAPFSRYMWAKNMYDSSSQRDLLAGLMMWLELRGRLHEPDLQGPPPVPGRAEGLVSPLHELPIPPYWTAEQAAAVHELLEVLQQAIWRVHGADIVRLYEAQTELRCDRSEDDDDHDDRDIPF